MASKIVRRIVNSAAGPAPVGPYSQAIVVDRTVYLSGVLGLDKSTGKLVNGGAVSQARLALSHIKAILTDVDSGMDKVVKTTIFLNSLDDFVSVNEVYKEFFVDNYPARSTFQVGKLPMGALVEIEAIALTGPVETVVSKY